jgi:ribonuclease BN (tRNA processing enzyme)
LGDVRVRLLGTGSPSGNGARMQACILVEHNGGRFLLDCGATSMVALARAGVDPLSLDAVLLSHLHGDHFGGLPFLLLELLDSRRDNPLAIAGPPETEERVRQALDVFGYPGVFERVRDAGSVEFIPLALGANEPLRGTGITAYRAIHTPEALIQRVVCDGKVIAYSGDTGWTDALIEAAAGADLFICQVYTYETVSRTMLSYRTVMEKHSLFSCKRLVLTHLGPEIERHLTEIEHAAEDGWSAVL